jgi:hypothetical protein
LAKDLRPIDGEGADRLELAAEKAEKLALRFKEES